MLLMSITRHKLAMDLWPSQVLIVWCRTSLNVPVKHENFKMNKQRAIKGRGRSIKEGRAGKWPLLLSTVIKQVLGLTQILLRTTEQIYFKLDSYMF